MRFTAENRAKYDHLLRTRDRAHEVLRAASGRREEAMAALRDAKSDLEIFKGQYRDPTGAELSRREKAVQKAKAEYDRLTAEWEAYGAQWTATARLVSRCEDFMTKNGIRIHEEA